MQRREPCSRGTTLFSAEADTQRVRSLSIYTLILITKNDFGFPTTLEYLFSILEFQIAAPEGFSICYVTLALTASQIR